MENPNTNKSVIDQATAVANNETVTETVNEATNQAQTTAQKAVQTVADEAGKTADTVTDKSTGKATDAAATQTERENRRNERRDRDGHHGGGCGNRKDCGAGCHPRRCRAGKWLAMIGLMLASGIIGGMIGGKIGSHGHHDRFDRMPHGGMMQRDGMRGGPMGQGMGPGAGMGMGQGQGQGMAQPDPAGQRNPLAPAAQNPQANQPAAPTQNR